MGSPARVFRLVLFFTLNGNTGGSVKILAGISGDRVVLWGEVGKSWTGDRASEMYHGPIMKILKKRGIKKSYLVVEDNDPTGYKSSKGRAAKKTLGIKTVKWPRYSPDLMPLDFSLWQDVQRRMDASAPSGYEYKGSVQEEAASHSAQHVEDYGA